VSCGPKAGPEEEEGGEGDARACGAGARCGAPAGPAVRGRGARPRRVGARRALELVVASIVGVGGEGACGCGREGKRG
jgi:hypothetical protein